MFTQPLSTCEHNRNDSYTYSYQKHEPSGFCLYLKGLDGINKLFNPIIHTKQSDDEDIASAFVSKLVALTNKIYKDYYKKPKPLKLSKRNKRNLIKRRFATFVIKYSTVKNQPSSKSETIATSLESMVVQHTTPASPMSKTNDSSSYIS